MASKKILIVEDDSEIRKILCEFLDDNGYETSSAGDGNEASEKLSSDRFDVVLMDMMLPYRSGDVLIQELRNSDDISRRRTPVIVISAKTRKDTRLEVLRMGADDYITKPFDLDEVLVRIEVVLRRTEDQQEAGDTLEYGKLVFNRELNTVSYDGKSLKLTAKELMLLELFLKNPKKPFTKANLYESVWQDIYCYEDNTINVHMSNLRAKLKKAAGHEYIETVWGIGYKLGEID